MKNVSEIKEQIKGLIGNNHLDTAYQLIQGNLELLGVNSETCSMLGVIYFNMGNFDLAGEVFKRGLLLDLSNLDILFNLGVLELSNNSLDECLMYFTAAKRYCRDAESNDSINIYITEAVKKLHSGQACSSSDETSFLDALIKEVLSNLNNNFYDNIDHDSMMLDSPDSIIFHPGQSAARIHNNMEGIALLYNKLADSESKVLLVKLMAYWILGHHKIKLPLNNVSYWAERNNIKCLAGNDTLKVNFRDWEFNLFNLENIGYPIKIYNLPNGIQTTFSLRQYEHPEVKVNVGDFVIDAGGCYGDTALYFAHLAGEQGHVYSFEFIDSNLEIMKINFSMNKTLADRITVIDKPLWKESDHELFYIDNGPASMVSNEPIGGDSVRTVAIDEFMRENNVPKIDFIKMDIEGAELNALKGARHTIVKHKPKMAICLYHSINDFATIIEYLSGLGLNYNFYLGHFTIFHQETILFAAPAAG